MNFSKAFNIFDKVTDVIATIIIYIFILLFLLMMIFGGEFKIGKINSDNYFRFATSGIVNNQTVK